MVVCVSPRRANHTIEPPVELHQVRFAYPEEWSAIVDAIKKGQVPPNPPG